MLMFDQQQHKEQVKLPRTLVLCTIGPVHSCTPRCGLHLCFGCSNGPGALQLYGIRGGPLPELHAVFLVLLLLTDYLEVVVLSCRLAWIGPEGFALHLGP